MDLKRMRERAHAWHLARRGDAMLGAQEFWDGMFYLSRELIPEDDREISRDLFGLIAYSWGVAAEKGRGYDPFDVLRTIRDRTWLGYADTAALIEQVGRDLPRAEIAGRMTAYFSELAAKRATYLFLPIVSRIDRHQLGPLPQQLELDRTISDYNLSPAGHRGAPTLHLGAALVHNSDGRCRAPAQSVLSGGAGTPACRAWSAGSAPSSRPWSRSSGRAKSGREGCCR
jgi:hypothetical protein